MSDIPYQVQWDVERGPSVRFDEPIIITAKDHHVLSLLASDLDKRMRKVDVEQRAALVDLGALGLTPYSEEEAACGGFPLLPMDGQVWGRPGGLDVGDPVVALRPVPFGAADVGYWTLAHAGFGDEGAQEISMVSPVGDIVAAISGHVHGHTAEDFLAEQALVGNPDLPYVVFRAAVRRGDRALQASAEPSMKVPYTALKRHLGEFGEGPGDGPGWARLVQVTTVDVIVEEVAVAVAAVIRLPGGSRESTDSLWAHLVQTGLVDRYGLHRFEVISPPDSRGNPYYRPETACVYVTRTPGLLNDDVRAYVGQVAHEVEGLSLKSSSRTA